jgi:hypothetical protein
LESAQAMASLVQEEEEEEEELPSPPPPNCAQQTQLFPGDRIIPTLRSLPWLHSRTVQSPEAEAQREAKLRL